MITDTTLVVSKDILGARMIKQLLESSKPAGKIKAVLEGRATEILGESEALEVIFTSRNEAETLDVIPEKILINERISFVLVSLSNPINLEERFALAANKLGIPVIGCEDYWGGHLRTTARLSALLTIDELGQSIACRMYEQDQVKIVGNPAIDPALHIPSQLRNKIEALRQQHGPIAIFTDSGAEAAASQIRLLVECVKMSNSQFCVMPRFHPKWATVQDPNNPGSTYHDAWQRLFEPIADRLVGIDFSPTDPIAALTDATFSGSSSLLTTAAYHGRESVSLLTPETVRHLQQESGGLFVQAPLVQLGLAREIRKPQSLDHLFRRLEPYDSACAAAAVAEFIGG